MYEAESGAGRSWLACCTTLAVLSVGILCHSLTHGAEPSGAMVEGQAKAEFLLNFAKFVHWPDASFATPDAPLVVGVLGDNPFGNLVAETVRGETVKGRRLEFRHFPSIMQKFESAHLLFVSRSEKNKLPTIFKELKGRPVLTIGDTEGFAQSGGMINFIIVSHDLHFEINTKAAEGAGLSLSSKLLDLPKAIRVRADQDAN